MIRRVNAWHRREFLNSLMLASGAGMLGVYPELAVAEPPPETTTIKLLFDPKLLALCYGPELLAVEFLYQEGFEKVEYATYGPEFSDAKVIGDGEADISTVVSVDLLFYADRGLPIAALGGMHVGCTEIFAGEDVSSFKDLKGKKIALYAYESLEHIWFSTLMSYVGLDPKRDIEWVIHPYEEWGNLLESGEVDAIMLWAPAVQEFREKGIGHSVMSTTTDKPWRHYFCCIFAGNKDFVDSNPIATKRAMRAFLKATDLCANDPAGAARRLVDSGFPFDHDRAVEVFSELPYAAWREYDPVDTLRFYALRMQDTDFLKSTPEELITRITDLRIFNELKRELKA